MTSQNTSKRPALTLIVTEEPRLRAPVRQVHTATEGGEVVDPFWASVISLVAHMKREHGRILHERPCEGPDVLVTLPDDCAGDQIEQAFKLIRKEGFEIWPGALYNEKKIYLGRREAEA